MRVLAPVGEAGTPLGGGLGGVFVGRKAFFAASSSLIHGRKLAASNSGNSSRRLEISPFGSITIAGMLSIAASSNSARHKPVLPEPVMPNTTPWVTRSLES